MNEGEIVSSELFVYILCTIFVQQQVKCILSTYGIDIIYDDM